MEHFSIITTREFINKIGNKSFILMTILLPIILSAIGFLLAFIGVLVVISNGKFSTFLNLNFVEGDIWILGAAISWALYSVYVLYWNSKFNLFTKFTLIAFFGSLSLFPFYLYEVFY